MRPHAAERNAEEIVHRGRHARRLTLAPTADPDDDLAIPRIKGRRGEVRRDLAAVSRAALDLHRRDEAHAAAACPLCAALAAPPR